jgi:hypothetical protein
MSPRRKTTRPPRYRGGGPSDDLGLTGTAVGYARSMDAKDENGLERQRRAIRAAAGIRGLSIAWSLDTTDHREALDRKGIARSLRLLRSGRYSALMVADLMCLAESLGLLAALFDRSREEGWAIISLGPVPFDTTRKDGKLLRAVLSRYASAASAATPTSSDGGALAAESRSTMGRWSTRDRIAWDRIIGSSLGQIANRLNRDGVAVTGDAAGSGSWHPSTVWAELEAFRPPAGEC